MRYNLNNRLERVHFLLNNEYVDQLDQTPVKAASLKYLSLPYYDADESHVNLPKSLSAVIGKDSKNQ